MSLTSSAVGDSGFVRELTSWLTNHPHFADAPRLAVTSLTHCEDPLAPQERGSSHELPHPTQKMEEQNFKTENPSSI